jgi:uncharacterized protein (DUF2235 family)
MLTYQTGTWLNSDDGLANGKRVPPSNVSRIAWAMKNTSRDGIPQVVYYQAGVGSTGTTISRILGGAIGAGLKENVREAYSYLSINYRPGDEIFLLGFSRGAYTARAVGGTIGDLGLLTKEGLAYFPEIYEDYQHRNDARYVSKFPDIPFPNKPPFDDPRYVGELEKRGLTVTRIPIKAIGVWDTVGSLGIPRVPFLESLGLQSRRMKDLRFYDTQLYDGIENAFQALALDEPRAPFAPTLWEKGSRNTRTNLTQVWFPGVHSNIGGGYDDQEMANITLAWMMSRLEPFIDFRPEYIQSVYESNRQYYKRTKQKTRWWSFGEIYNSAVGVYALAGTKVRTPGNYYRVDPVTGRPTKKLLKNTNEYIHASARSRTGLGGPGIQDRGIYESKALREWQFSTEEPSGDATKPMIVWTDHSDRDEGQKVIPEAILLPTERVLLENNPRVEDYVLDIKAPVKRRSKRRSKPPE